MKKTTRMYGTTVFHPVSFPDVIEERFYLHNKDTDEHLRFEGRATVSLGIEPLRPWTEFVAIHNLSEHTAEEGAATLASGEPFVLNTCFRDMTYEEDAKIPGIAGSIDE